MKLEILNREQEAEAGNLLQQVEGSCSVDQAKANILFIK